MKNIIWKVKPLLLSIFEPLKCGSVCGNNFDKPARLIRNDKMPSYILITEERGEVVRSCS